MRRKYLVIAFLLSVGLSARADTILTYQGHNFTYATSPYTTSEAVSGTITLAGSLAPNLDGSTRITPVSYTFSAGPTTFTSGNSLDIGGIYLYTDASGNLLDFYLPLELLVLAPNQTSFLPAYYEDSLTVAYGATLPTAVGDGVGYEEQGIDHTGGAYSTSQGALTITTTTAMTPEPSSFAFLSTGMLGVVGVVRKRFA